MSGSARPNWLIVTASADCSEVLEDNGIGIDLDHAEQVFRLFERLHSQAEHEGTGTGLVLCKRIVERHGGETWIDPELGERTTFSFTFPAADT